MFVFFFFFQAEDGIRDHCVTGVQTCALPIFVTHSTQLEQHHKKLINCFRETTLILFNLTRSNLLSITFDTRILGYGMRHWVELVASGAPATDHQM